MFLGKNEDSKVKVRVSHNQVPLSNALQVFSSMGGLALLAQHLPTVYPETIRQPSADKPPPDQTESDWVKVDGKTIFASKFGFIKQFLNIINIFNFKLVVTIYMKILKIV